jgi:hypothetical protein
VRIVIADDSALLQEGLGRLLQEAGMEVVASVGTSKATRRRTTVSPI